MSFLTMDAETAAMLRGATLGDDHRLDPRETRDGRWALPAAVLGEPAFAGFGETLAGLETVVLGPGDWAETDDA
jgi:hypothetical protein